MCQMDLLVGASLFIARDASLSIWRPPASCSFLFSVLNSHAFQAASLSVPGSVEVGCGRAVFTFAVGCSLLTQIQAAFFFGPVFYSLSENSPIYP